MLQLEPPIPFLTPLGEGWAVICTSGGAMANDTWTVILDDGRVLHFLSSDLRHVGNATLGIERPTPGSTLAQVTQYMAQKVRTP